jgi:hypothetical protein
MAMIAVTHIYTGTEISGLASIRMSSIRGCLKYLFRIIETRIRKGNIDCWPIAPWSSTAWVASHIREWLREGLLDSLMTPRVVLASADFLLLSLKYALV